MAVRKKISVKCPKCKSEFNYYDSEARPFCSKRCKEVDLGNWFTESYRVPSSQKLDDSDLERVVSNMENSGESET